MSVRIDDTDDMGEWDVFARGRSARRLDGLWVIRSGGESNREARSDFAECLRNQVGMLRLVGGLSVPGSRLFRNSDGMTIERDRCGIYRGPNRGVNGEFLGSARASSSITWNMYRHFVKIWVF